MRLCWILVGLGMLCLVAGARAEAPVPVYRIGVLATTGPADTRAAWTPTADYLSARVPNARFTILPLSLEEIKTACAQRQIDFVLTNPAQYVDVEMRYGVSRLVTLKRLHRGEVACRNYASVLFARADRHDIVTLDDLKGRSLMAVDPNAFAGWWMLQRELKDRQIDPAGTFREIRFAHGRHDEVVLAVRDRQADVGTVRADILESMAAEGKIRMSDFRVVNLQTPTPEYPFLRSTRLYPEWPFATLKRTPDELAQQVTIALLQMPATSPAAGAAGVAGWTSPLDYTPVHECLKELRLPPYEDFGKVSLRDTIRHHWPWFLGGFLLFELMLITTGYVLRLNSRLRRLQVKLEKELAQRSSAQLALQHSRERYRALVEQVSEAIYLVDMSTKRILDFNAAFRDLLGYPPDRARTLTLYDLVDHPREEVEAQFLKATTSISCTFGQRRYRRGDGSILMVEVSSSVIYSGGQRVLCILARDCTETINLERQIRQLQQDLQALQTQHAQQKRPPNLLETSSN